MPQRVAVIGAGASGLATLRHLAGDPEHFTPVGLERAETVGGLWVYSDDTDTDNYGLPVHSAIYRGLRTNVFKNIVGYPDFPMPDNASSFPGHEQVSAYLRHYADSFDLHKYIKFQTLVMSVVPREVKGHVTWDVTTRDLATNDETTSCFDSVMVCNGHEATPLIPEIAGQDSYKGDILHSKSYRRPERYAGQTVLLVGMSFSGLDLTYELARVAKTIYCSHNNPGALLSELPSNAIEKPGVREITPDGAIFTDGGYVQCDVIIFCTGYRYSFPFIGDSCKVTIEENRICPLYKHMVSIEYPTLFFIGLPKRSLTFRLSHEQAAYACALLRGDVKLPSQEVMRRDEEQDFRRRVTDAGQHPKMTHDLFGPDCTPQWQLFDFLTTETKSTPIAEVTKKLFQYHVHLWTTRFHNFRSLKCEIINGKDFNLV